MYLRFIGAKILEGIGWILCITFFPLVYACRYQIDKGVWWTYPLYYLSNQDEPNHLENWYGFYELLPLNDAEMTYESMSSWARFKMSFEWVALRNPSWQLKLAIGNHLQGEVSRVKVKRVVGEADAMTWRNKWITGLQSTTFYIGKVKCFRYSFTKKILGKWVNVMLGAQEGRYVSKFRVFSELGRWG